MKDRRRLLAAYNDSSGVTAEFNLNVLNVLNRELKANFDAQKFFHLADFDQQEGWINLWLVSKTTQEVVIPVLSQVIHFEEAERLRTEVSVKFRPNQLEEELIKAGFGVRERFADLSGDYALLLAQRGIDRAPTKG